MKPPFCNTFSKLISQKHDVSQQRDRKTLEAFDSIDNSSYRFALKLLFVLLRLQFVLRSNETAENDGFLLKAIKLPSIRINPYID